MAAKIASKMVPLPTKRDALNILDQDTLRSGADYLPPSLTLWRQ